MNATIDAGLERKGRMTVSWSIQSRSEARSLTFFTSFGALEGASSPPFLSFFPIFPTGYVIAIRRQKRFGCQTTRKMLSRRTINYRGQKECKWEEGVSL